MKRIRRLGIRAALALALAIKEQDAQAALNTAPLFDEGWAPFLPEGAVPMFAIEVDEADAELPVPADDDEENGKGDEQRAPAMLFSHFARAKDGVRTYVRQFGSVQDFCEQPFANLHNEGVFSRDCNGGKFFDYDELKAIRVRLGKLTADVRGQAQHGNEAWYGAPSAASAMHRAYKGWPEGAERVRRLMDTVEAPPPASLRRKVQRGDQGDALDIHQVYRGGLDRAWERRRRLNSRSRMSVRLVAELGGSNMMNAEEMFWRGAAVAKLAELLEESGYRVEVIGVEATNLEQSWFSSAEGEQATVLSTFTVKDAGAPVDLEQIAGVLCNSGFFRTYGFRANYAACEHKIRDAVRNKDGHYEPLLARSTMWHGNAVEELSLADDGTRTFVVPTRVGDHESAEKWVRETLQKLDNKEGGEGDDEAED